jgi:hypothetical protein
MSCAVGDMLLARGRCLCAAVVASQPSGKLTAELRLLRASPVALPAQMTSVRS